MPYTRLYVREEEHETSVNWVERRPSFFYCHDTIPAVFSLCPFFSWPNQVDTLSFLLMGRISRDGRILIKQVLRIRQPFHWNAEIRLGGIVCLWTTRRVNHCVLNHRWEWLFFSSPFPSYSSVIPHALTRLGTVFVPEVLSLSNMSGRFAHSPPLPTMEGSLYPERRSSRHIISLTRTRDASV